MQGHMDVGYTEMRKALTLEPKNVEIRKELKAVKTAIKKRDQAAAFQKETEEGMKRMKEREKTKKEEEREKKKEMKEKEAAQGAAAVAATAAERAQIAAKAAAAEEEKAERKRQQAQKEKADKELSHEERFVKHVNTSLNVQGTCRGCRWSRENTSAPSN